MEAYKSEKSVSISYLLLGCRFLRIDFGGFRAIESRRNAE
jgi:hypothetical protein